MKTVADRNKIWVQSIILDTIMSKENLKKLGIPKDIETYVTNRVCSYVAEKLVVDEKLEDELFLYCEYVAKSPKGVHSPLLEGVFELFLNDNVDNIRDIINSCLVNLN